MNRRRFLSFIGLAPVAAAVPAMALPRPEKPLATGGVVKGKVDYLVGEKPSESIRFLNVDTRGADPEALAKLERDVRNQLIELHRALPKHIGIRFNQELRERVESDQITREGGKRHYTVSF